MNDRALPAVRCIVRESFSVLPTEWLWDVAFANFARRTAESLSPVLIPRRLGVLLSWPALAALEAVALLRPRRPEG